MSSQITALEAAPTKHLYTDVGSVRVDTPPSAAVRVGHVQDEIEMNAMGTGRNTEPSINSENIEPEINARKEWFAIAACCWCLFLNGWNDAAIGTILPAIRNHYDLSFTVISLLFVFGCVGSISAAVLNVYLNDRLGFGRVMLFGALCQVLAYSILVPAFPFPVMCLAYVINGFGMGLQDYQANGFVAALPYNTSAKMGLLHSGYGAGAFIAPMVSTRLLQYYRWSFLYLAPLSMAAIDAVVLFTVFRFHTQEELLGPVQIDPSEAASNQRKYHRIFRSWPVQLFALFSLLYVGTETTIGGWIVTFVVEERGLGQSAGLISSGFFGGLMVGRIILLWLNARIGERIVVYFYIALMIGLELTVWLLPNVIGNAVAISLVGILMG
ncbi:major facilitator superfamily transporter [Ceratobasidium sp. AG-Ba]|nr:major facilitator superfamily transporter [Ceratobasidium sp. AG-Ba]QRV99610.1 major facilitator superfamily transporter [Ceratobasidium sp. AG-Ba]QRW14141.1 major facilitator superfamily transporter [Ceratobasidium sp. AG-Ba]